MINKVADALITIAETGDTTQRDVENVAAREEHGIFTDQVTSGTMTLNEFNGTVFLSGGTYTLPTAVGIGGRIYALTNAAVSTATVNTTGGETISGFTEILLTEREGIIVQSDSINWFVISDAFTPAPSFGQNYEDNIFGVATPVVITGSGNFTGWTSATGAYPVSSNLLSFVNNATADRILVGVDGGGYYEVSYSCALSTSANRTFAGFAVFVNGVQQTASLAIGRTDNNGEGGGGSNTIILNLSSGDYIDFRFTADAAVTISIHQATSSIIRIQRN